METLFLYLQRAFAISFLFLCAYALWLIFVTIYENFMDWRLDAQLEKLEKNRRRRRQK